MKASTDSNLRLRQQFLRVIGSSIQGLDSIEGDNGHVCPVAQNVQSQLCPNRLSTDPDTPASAAMAYHTSSTDLGHVPEHLSMSNVMEPEMVMPNSDEETPGSPSTPGSNRRYATSGTGPLKRAVSSPNVRSLGDGTTLSAADKKRNKLGYHRTAVACGRKQLCAIFFPTLTRSRTLPET